MRTVESRPQALGCLRWLAAACLVILSVLPAQAQVAAGYSEYYIPGSENAVSAVLTSLGPAPGSPDTHAIISVTAWSPNTTLYVDHWEDTYDFDPANPTSADETYTLSTGVPLVFESANIEIPRDSSTTCDIYRNGTLITAGTTTCYDGGDRIYVAGGAVTVTRAAWIEEQGATIQAVAWEVYPVKPQLTTYVLPFGENLAVAPKSYLDFLRVAVLIQATDDGTTFQVDLDGNGTWDQLDTDANGTVDSTTVNLSRGQTFLLNDASAGRTPGATGITSNSVIQGNKTLQVKIIIGDPAANYETRGLSAFPRGYWTKDYYASVGQPAAARNTDVFLYNPHATTLTVSYQTGTGSGTFTINPQDTVSFRRLLGGTMPAGGVYFSGSDVLWGVSTIDSEGQAFEWAYSLLPTTLLYAEHFLGWAPDTSPTPGAVADRDNDGVFLTVAQDNTRVFVDLNNDGTVDQTYTLSRLQSQYISDPSDGDLSGAHFWATGPFTMSYGENPDTAQASTASLDLGYVAIPATDFISLVLTTDKSVSPQLVPTAAGSVATFTIKVNSQKYTVNGVNVTDFLPAGWGYVVGTDTTTITRPDKTTFTGAGAHPAGAGTLTTLVWSSAQLGGNMAENQEITISFTARTTAVLALGTLSQNRVQAVGTRTVGGATQTFTATDFAYVTTGNSYGAVAIDKTSSAATPLYPGDTFTYTTVVTNPAGSGTTLTNVSLLDPIPTGVSYVPGSGSVTCVLSGSQNVRDQFSAAAYDNTNGSVNWSGNPWAETDAYGAGATGATGGFVYATGTQLQFRYPPSSSADDFSSETYSGGTGLWAGDWTETNDDGAVGGGNIRIDGDARIEFRKATVPGQSIQRAAYVSGATSVVASYGWGGNTAGIDADDDFIVEYSSDGGTSWNYLRSIDGSGGAATYTDTIAWTPTNDTIILRFRAEDALESESQNSGGNEQARIDNVSVTPYSPTSASGTQILRTVNLTGATSATLSFAYTGDADNEAGDTIVVEASSNGSSFTILETFNGTTGSATRSYNLISPVNYTSANTTIRFRVTSGFNATGEAFSIDNVDITWNASTYTLKSGNPPEFLSASAGCQIGPGGSPVTLTFNATVVDPLPSGLTEITNTASTTSTQFPIAISDSVTNIVANPSVLSATVGDRVWLDADGDGSQDVGEPGLANVEVTLKDQWGAPVAITVTDVNGRYLFTGVNAGPGYYVEVTPSTLPGGLTQAFPVGSANNRTTTFTLSDGQNYTGADAGYKPSGATATFGDQVWVDANNYGVRDAGEIGLGGITVELWSDNGNGVLGAGDTLAGTKTTAPDGSYLFTGVTASGTQDYIVNVPTQASLTGYTATTPTFRSYPDVSSGGAYLDADFGYRGTGVTTYSIQDRVWFDTNGNGLFAGESGIGGVTMELLNASLQVIGTTTTAAADGTFTFSGLAGGGADYTTRISDNAGVLINYYGTTIHAQAGQRAESNLAGNLDRRAAPSYGFLASRSIGDTIFYDTSNFGTQEPGENGMAGVAVNLYRDTDDDGVLDVGEPLVGTVTTDANGKYLFSGLSNDYYVVSVPIPSGYTFSGPGTDSDGAPSNGIQKGRQTSGANILDVDYGFRATTPRLLSGRIWNDTNTNGSFDGTESGIAGVTLDVLSGSTLVATVTTDASGLYSVSGLTNVVYTVRVTDTNSALTGYAPTFERTEGANPQPPALPFNYQESVDLGPGDVTTVDFGYAKPLVTYAAVAQLRAYLDDGSVTIEWRTSLESGTVGFHLLRLDPATGQYVQLTERLVPGLVVHPQGGVYRFRDAGAPTEGRLTYALLEQDVHGRSHPYGPYTISVAARAASRALDAAATEDLRRRGFSRQATAPTRARQALRATVQVERQLASAQKLRRRGRVFKVTTRETGIHHLPAAGIVPSFGLPAERVASLIRAGQITLSHRGSVVPYLPDGSGAGFYFYAEPVGSPYTDENAYWVTVAPGPTMRARPAVPTGLLNSSFMETLHQEQDQYPLLTTSHDPEGDFWIWDYLYAGYDGLDAKTFTIRASGVAGAGDASLTVHLLGGTDSAPGDDHHVQVLFNGLPVGEAQWDGLAPFDLGIPVSAASVLEGENVVEVKAVLDSGVSESLFYVDSFDLMYERRYQAVDDDLTFTAANGTDVAVGGFSGPGVLLFDVTLPSRPVLMTNHAVSLAGDGRYEVRFGAAGASETLRYQALLPGRAKAPTAVVAWQDTGLRRGTNAADYVLVAPESLREAATSLADYRNGRGMATTVVGLEDIYDEFNAGIAEPGAIRTFLSHATSRWSTPPRYVTLVGRGTWDYRNLRGFGDNLVPTLLVDSPDGLMASDVAYGDVAGNDGIPEVALGRLPVLTAQDLLDYVAKIQAHESAPSGEWQHRVLLTADNADAAGNFPADSESVAALLPTDYTVGRVHLDTTTPVAGRLAILQGVNDGVVAFNYIGHGGFDRLADENLFTSADVASLNNAGRLTVFLAMTCSVGDFAQPGYPSLGEAMLLRKDGGAFAVWAPSGLSQNSLAVQLDQSFFRGAFVDDQKVVGDLVVRGIRELVTPGSQYMRYMYNLLGEPVSRLPD